MVIRDLWPVSGIIVLPKLYPLVLPQAELDSCPLDLDFSGIRWIAAQAPPPRTPFPSWGGEPRTGWGASGGRQKQLSMLGCRSPKHRAEPVLLTVPCWHREGVHGMSEGWVTGDAACQVSPSLCHDGLPWVLVFLAQVLIKVCSDLQFGNYGDYFRRGLVQLKSSLSPPCESPLPQKRIRQHLPWDPTGKMWASDSGRDSEDTQKLVSTGHNDWVMNEEEGGICN